MARIIPQVGGSRYNARSLTPNGVAGRGLLALATFEFFGSTGASSSASFSIAGTSTVAFTSSSLFAASFSSAGTSTAAFTSSSLFAASFSSAGLSTVTWVSAANAPATFSIAGTSAFSPVAAGGALEVYVTGVEVFAFAGDTLVWGQTNEAQTPAWTPVIDAQTVTWSNVADTQTPAWVEILT